MKWLNKLFGRPIKLHYCSVGFPPAEGSNAFFVNCQENEMGDLIVGTPSYNFLVNYCPLCGYKSNKPPFKKSAQ